MIEKTITSETIYKGNVVSLRVDTVEGPKGITTREIIDHVPAVTIIPYKAPNHVVLIHQYRKAVDQILIEAPAGCMEPREDPLHAAIRELKEETGFSAQTLTKVGEMYMAPGFCNEYMHYYIAEELMAGETSFDDDEHMELKQYALEDLMDMIQNRQIIDAKTIMGIYFLNEYLQSSRI